MRRHRHHDDRTGIDLAPMLDFVLNLLIFFIVTAVFVKQAGMPLNRPGGAAAAGGKSSGALAVSVEGNGDIYVDGRVIDLRSVRANVERFHSLKPDDGVIVVAAPKAASGIVVEVVDQIRQAGVQNVAFATARGKG